MGEERKMLACLMKCCPFASNTNWIGDLTCTVACLDVYREKERGETGVSQKPNKLNSKAGL